MEEARTQVTRSRGGRSGACPASSFTAEASRTHGGEKVTEECQERRAGRPANRRRAPHSPVGPWQGTFSAPLFFFHLQSEDGLLQQSSEVTTIIIPNLWTKKARHREVVDSPKATRLAGLRALYVCKVGPTMFHTFTLYPQLSRKTLNHHPVLLMRKMRPKKSELLPAPPRPQSGEAEATC